MAGVRKTGGKAKPKAAKSAKPAAKHVAKKAVGTRKLVRKTAAPKHTTKAKATNCSSNLARRVIPNILHSS